MVLSDSTVYNEVMLRYLSFTLIENNFWYFRNSPFGFEVILGENHAIGVNTNIVQSVIGNNVRIGSNVYIEKSTIMSDVIIMDNNIIINSIIGPKCTINANCKLTSGCVLGPEIVLGQETVLGGAILELKERRGNIFFINLTRVF